MAVPNKSNKSNKSNESNESSESVQSNPDDTKLSDTDTDTDNDNDNDNDIVIDSEKGAAIAALIGSPSPSFNPITTSDEIQPLVLVDSLPDEVFKSANIDKDNVTTVVQYYCRIYRQRFGKSCIAINEDFAKRLPGEIAVLIDKESGEYLIDTDKWEHNSQDYIEWYESMIDKYFDTKFNDGCNYSLQHFFSGNIRVLRFKEVGREPVEL